MHIHMAYTSMSKHHRFFHTEEHTNNQDYSRWLGSLARTEQLSLSGLKATLRTGHPSECMHTTILMCTPPHTADTHMQWVGGVETNSADI